MGGHRPGEPPTVAQRHDDCPSAPLRHPEAGGVEDARLGSIVRSPAGVDPSEGTLDLGQRRYRPLGEAGHVLHEDRLREEGLGKVQEPVQAVGSLVIEADARRARPLGGFREWLAGWRSGEKRQLSASQAYGMGSQRLRRIKDVTGLQQWPLVVPVRFEGSPRDWVQLDASNVDEPSCLQSEVEPSDT
jgi:hypothetical protein